ncbi:MAG: hypothetical protein ACPGU7_04745, partial [Gammaproteobacteria bacterium]
ATLIDFGSDAEITDHGEPDLDGGTLTVSADDYLGGEVTLGLRDGYQGVSVVSTSLVMVDGLVVGTIVSNADGQGEDLKITWNEHSTLDKADKVIQALTVEHSGDLLGATNPTLTIESSDATGTAVSPSTVTVSLVDVNNAPTVSGDTSVSVDEQVGLTLSGLTTPLSITDVDADGADLEMVLSLSADQGDISVDTAGTSLTGVTGNDSTLVTVTGSLDELNDLLDGTLGNVIFTGNTDTPDASVVLNVNVNDLGNTDENPANTLTASQDLTITVNPVNDAPDATVTGPLNATEDVALDLAGALDVSDPDAGSGDVSVTLSVNDGTLNLDRGSNTNVEVLNSANGQDVSEVTLVGTVQEINDLLDGLNSATLTYTSDDSPDAATSITVSIDDDGNTGGTVGLTDSASLAINVTPVDDDPEIRLDAEDSAPNDSTLTDIGVTAAGGGDPVSFVTSADGSDNLVLPDNATPGSADEITSLTIGHGGSFESGEQLLILGDSSTTTTIDLNAEELPGSATSGVVTVGGVAFDVTVDQGADTITFTPNGAPTSATEAEFEALLEALRYEHTSLTPTTTPDREFTFTVEDTDTNTGTATATVVVTDAPRPTIDNLGGTVVYTEGDGEVLLDDGSDAAIGDQDDTVHLQGGTLTVSSDNYLSSQITLGFASGSDVSVVDTNTVEVSGTVVGTIVGGNDGVATDLLVHWTTTDATHANIDEVIRALTVRHDGDLLGGTDPVITIESSDNDGTAVAPSSVTISLVDVNNAPTVSGDTSVSVDEQVGLTLSGLTTPLSITDVDADGADLEMVLSLSADQGDISVDTAGTSLTGVTGNDSTLVTVTGSLDELNDLLDGTLGNVIFTGNTDTPDASVVLNVNVNDLGNTDENPANTLTASQDLTITVNPINDAPDATIDAQPVIAENATQDLAGTLRVSDPDAGTGDVTVTLSVNDGTISVDEGSNTVAVTPVSDGEVVLVGTLDEINDVLDGNESAAVSYVSDDSPDPDTSLTLTINDGGNTGGPGAQSATAVADLNVTDSDDAPQVILDPRDGLSGQDADVGESIDYSADLVAGTGPVPLMTTGSGNTSDNLVLPDNDGPGGATDDLMTTLVIDYSGTPVAGDPDPGEIIIIGSATVDLDAGTVDTATVTIGGNPYTIAVNGGSQQIEVTADGAGVTASEFEQLMEALRYDHTDDTPANEGDRTLVLTVTDDDGQTGSANAVISVAENQPPTVSVPNLTATEGVPLDLTGKITVDDPDTVADVDIQSVTLSVSNGVLNVAAGGTGVGVTGSGSGTVVLTGTESQIDNLLAGLNNADLTYLQSADVPPGSAVLTVTASDGSLTGDDTGTIAITPVNDLPEVFVPDLGPVNEGGATLGLLGEGITVDDVDNAPTDIMALTLSVPVGRLNVTGLPAGITVASGAGTDRLVLRGTEADLDAFLAGNSGGALDYVSPADAPKGPFQLSAELNDGAGSDRDQGALDINHLPEFSNPPSVEVTSGSKVMDLGGRDDDPDTFTYAIQPGLDGALFEVVNGSELRFKSSPVDGDYSVSLRISDGRGGFRTQTFNVSVNLPAPPVTNPVGPAPTDEGSGNDGGLPDLANEPQDTGVESLFDGGLGQTESKVQIVGDGGGQGPQDRPFGVGSPGDGPEFGGGDDLGGDGLGAGGAQGGEGADSGDGFDPGGLVTDAGNGTSDPEGGSPDGDVDGPDRFARAPLEDQRIGAGSFNDFGADSPAPGPDGSGSEGGDNADATGEEADPAETEFGSDTIFGADDFGFDPQLAGVFGTPGDGVDPGGGERPDDAGAPDPFGGSGLFVGQGEGVNPFRGPAGDGGASQGEGAQGADEGGDLDFDTASGEPLSEGLDGPEGGEGPGQGLGPDGLPGLGGPAAGGLGAPGGASPDAGSPGSGLFADGPGEGPDGLGPEGDPRQFEEEELGIDDGPAEGAGADGEQGAVGPETGGGDDGPSAPDIGPRDGTFQDVIDRAGTNDGEEEEEPGQAPSGEGNDTPDDGDGQEPQGGDSEPGGADGGDESGGQPDEGGEPPGTGETPEVELLGDNEGGDEQQARGDKPPSNA